MNETFVAKVNGVDIVTVDIDGETYVPIRPICQALGISDNGQRARIEDDDILASVDKLWLSTGADGKTYQMTCLPLKYVYGWIFTINPKKVAPEARETVQRYRRECYEALYERFAGSMRRTIEANNAEIELLGQINNAINEEKDARGRRKKAEEALDRLRAERLNPQPRLF